MLWKGRRGSTNIEDRRGKTSTKKLIGGSIGAIILSVVIYLFGGDTSGTFNTSIDDGSFTAEQRAEQTEDSAFVGVVLAETEDVWHEQFKKTGKTYKEPKLTLFNEKVESNCGFGVTTSGPFYCPEDKHIYIDLSFYKELKQRYKVEGDFAMAYVIAHETGHHVQNLLGTTASVQQKRVNLNKIESNKLSVKLELQADFYAGIWAHFTNKKRLLEAGDVEEALNAANAIGDDQLQRQANGRVTPDAFTHGTSQQRMYWFKKGFDTGDMNQGDTFNDPSL